MLSPEATTRHMTGPLAGARRLAFNLAAVALGAGLLAGCVRPLYGPTASGASLAEVLRSIDVPATVDKPGQERIGYYLAEELKYQLDGGVAGQARRYRLTLSLTESVQSAVVDTTTGRATAATLVGTAEYKLLKIGGADDAAPVLSGSAQASASYDRTPQRFAIVRAARDAEIRVAKQLAEQIKNRLAAGLLTKG